MVTDCQICYKLFTKQQNFRPVQIGGNDTKHFGKRRKCWLPAFSPFPTMFSKGFLYRFLKSHDCVVKS